MLENPNVLDWLTLQNPFSKISKQVTYAPTVRREMDVSQSIIGHVSGRGTDITRIIMNEQRAIFLVGAPYIGKSTLISYLQQHSNDGWSWRDELMDLQGQLKLDDIHFVQIDLTPLEGIEDNKELLNIFVKQCILALRSVYLRDKQESISDLDLKGLRRLLRIIRKETPNARYFMMLDSIERLASPGLHSVLLNTSKAQTQQERGLALLDHCDAIRTLVDLIDEFAVFGVILSIESLPRSNIDDQFRYVSLDLARFTTMTLQAFTWDETSKILAQEPENFGANWLKIFKTLGGTYIFSNSEQAWLRRMAGTHPYLLQQFCLYTFRFKQEYADIHRKWSELQERNKTQLIESINEDLSAFLAPLWQRLQEAIEKSSHKARENFYEFIKLLAHKQTDDEVNPTFWDELGSELRYILYSEGIVRYDRLQSVHFPGYILSRYLIQKANREQSTLPVPITGKFLTISRPEGPTVSISLSELEYRLFKTLVQHPERCKEEELMKGAWGMLIERSRFTQRMHQLRRKLKEQGVGTEVIENSYGGYYSLNHPDRIHLN